MIKIVDRQSDTHKGFKITAYYLTSDPASVETRDELRPYKAPVPGERLTLIRRDEVDAKTEMWDVIMKASHPEIGEKCLHAKFLQPKKGPLAIPGRPAPQANNSHRVLGASNPAEG